MLPWVARNLIYKPIYGIRGEKVWKYRQEVRLFHTLSLEEMRKIQWEKLRSLLRYIYHNNYYYKELLDRYGIRVDKIDNPADYARIPFMTKNILKVDAENMITGRDYRFSSRHTSGSTGLPLRFVKDRDATAYMDAVMYEVYGWHGIEMGDRQSRIWAMPLGFGQNIITRLKDFILNRRRLNAFCINRKSSINFFKSLRRFKPKFMYGLPNTMIEFVKLIEEANLRTADLRLKVIVTTGEIMYPEHRLFLERSFECPVVNEYGATEGGIIAFECKNKRKHLMLSNLYLEYIDPDTGETASPGEAAEIVITDLQSYGMPFIRYRVGDLVKPSPNKCQCGLELPLIDEIIGKVSDLIITPDGRKISPTILPYSLPGTIQEFRAIQRSRRRLEILIKDNNTINNKDLVAIEKKLRTYFGEKMEIEFKLVKDIPPQRSGKIRYFISEINKNDGDSGTAGFLNSSI